MDEELVQAGETGEEAVEHREETGGSAGEALPHEAAAGTGSGGFADAFRQADVREFWETFPEAARNPQSIPPEVWAEVRRGRTLMGAYARYSRQQAAGAACSTGSMRTTESGLGGRDPFLSGFQES